MSKKSVTLAPIVEEPPAPVTEAPFKANKPKKPRTPAQVAAQQSALTALKAKRESLKAAEDAAFQEASEERQQEILQVKHQKVARRLGSQKMPPIVNYLTTHDLDKFKKELFAFLPKEIYRDIPGPEKIVEREKIVPVIKETVREVKVAAEPVTKILSGNALLDSIFFNK